MDIKANKDLFESLKHYNSNLKDNYGNSILEAPPKDKKYPYTVFQTFRDVANANYNSCYGKVSSKGYRVDIYAQNKGKVLRKDIAETLAQQIDDFMSCVGLTRVSYNFKDIENSGTTCYIIMTYSADLDEYRRKFF